MSIQSEIDRIETEVGTQSGLINQIQTELESKYYIAFDDATSTNSPIDNNTSLLQNTLQGVENAFGSKTEPLARYMQVNPVVNDYLTNVTYDPSDYSTSAILPYIYEETDYVKSYPVGYDINILEAGTLNLADNTIAFSQESSVGVKTLINMTPYAISHWWNVVSGNTKQNGTIEPLGYLRMIKTTASNVRDLGGWQCDGGRINYGKIFRGGLLYDTDREVLVNQLGIRYDINLLGDGDNNGITSSPLGSDIHFVATENYPWYSITDPNKKDMWVTILSTIFNAVKYNEPLIFNCAAGADRTGTVACIVEAILGVSQSNIDKDFELTSFAIAPNARRRTDTDWKNLIGEINSFVGDTFRNKVVNWLGTLGFTAAEINAFRQSVIDGNPESVTIESVYSIVNNLTNVTTNNTTAVIKKGNSYSANLSAIYGYTLDSVTVTMGGIDITGTAYNSDGKITIDSVTGDVVITAVGAEQPTGRLPAAYQECEWVQIINQEGGDSNSCVRTNIEWNAANKIVTKVQNITSTNANDIFFAAWVSATSKTTPYIATRTSKANYLFGAQSGLNNYSVTPNNIAPTDLNANEFTLNFTASSTGDICFGGWYDSTYSHPHKWYKVEIYNGDTLLANFVPCYRKADNRNGFYDLVGEAFYENAAPISGSTNPTSIYFVNRGEDVFINA